MSTHRYGPNHYIIDKFIKHVSELTDDDWINIRSVWKSKSGNALWTAAQNAGFANRTPTTQFLVSLDAINDIRNTVKTITARTASGDPAWDTAIGAVTGAVSEIQGAVLMRERNHSFFFLPMFGFDNEQAVLKWYQKIIHWTSNLWLTLVTRFAILNHKQQRRY